MKEIKVSIVCNTYNHEAYIVEALESFINQITNFDYEILVHDDASTDHTADIIRNYAEKYPNLIKPIYQIENQYSQRNTAVIEIQYARAKGKYIAICEGDDYWCDNLKLQKQYDIMETHSEIDMCTHRARYYNSLTDKVIKEFPNIDCEKILCPEEVIMGDGGFLATNSLFFRREMIKENPPFKNFWDIDYTLQIQGSLRGGIYYLPEVMSVYRFMTNGSWSATTYRNVEIYDAVLEKKQKMLDILNDDTEGIYSKIIENKKNRNEYEACLWHDNYKEMLLPKFKKIRDELRTIEIIKIYIKAYFPIAFKIKRFLKNL